jgi:hypothetical protein
VSLSAGIRYVIESSISSDLENKILLLYSCFRLTEVKSFVSAENTMVAEKNNRIEQVDNNILNIFNLSIIF